MNTLLAKSNSVKNEYKSYLYASSGNSIMLLVPNSKASRSNTNKFKLLSIEIWDSYFSSETLGIRYLNRSNVLYCNHHNIIEIM